MKRGWLLRLYPRWWRDRYGAEFEALLEDVPVSARTILDMLADALDARLQPVPPAGAQPAEAPGPAEPAVAPEHLAAPRRRRGLGPIEHEIGIDRVIREAIERGDFDDLPGAGKPLGPDNYDLANDWRLAFHVLKQAGETLPWIALGKQIEADRQQLAAELELAARQRAAGLDEAARRRRRTRYLEQAARLDGLISSYNTQVPSIQLEQARLPADVARARFDAVWPPG